MRFCAPLAGYTHSAFRRLLAEFGGCGAVWTEMLAARQILHENFEKSPWLRRRPNERNVFYQLMVRAGDPFDRILGKLAEHGVEAVDLNLACDAPEIRACLAGSALFNNLDALSQVAEQCRRHWSGILTAKIRLGDETPEWQKKFAERVRVLEDSGIDALIVHTRFFREKFKRRARHEFIPWIAANARVPIIANGDIAGPEDVAAMADNLRPARAIMIGRHAIVRPWLFAAWDTTVQIDHTAVWHRMCDYIEEDFPPEVAFRRIQMFTKYFAANYAFGHPLRTTVSNARSIAGIRERATSFFAAKPRVVTRPLVAGV
ncbi:MAG: tRNA-dihydrouridine synthase family protein [Verrucomicrobiota bacterium]|nr:tRNA-dihydrouridine synthase family protein [Verrucomicrobiota bacterium]